jgi:HlyD family secretion protein
MKKKGAVILLALAVVTAAGSSWWFFHRGVSDPALVLYGNVDLRQVELAFNNSERIATVLVQEGDRVRAGQIVARLDVHRLKPQVEEVEAREAAQLNNVEKLHNGSRPEEIAQARANVASAKADEINARDQYQRQQVLAENAATSRQDLENARVVLDVADAKLAVSQKALQLALVGPRKEDIGEAEAELRADQAQSAFLHQELADAELVAPADAVVRARLMEPGEMASPQKPVLSLAIIDPKWVRAYVSEPELGRLQTGMGASVALDGFPHRFDGWVGFISPVAEFTPKNVQTEELRTSLVYEVRVFVKDPLDQLPLGAPASVYLIANSHQPALQTRVAIDGLRGSHQ